MSLVSDRADKLCRGSAAPSEGTAGTAPIKCYNCKVLSVPVTDENGSRVVPVLDVEDD